MDSFVDTKSPNRKLKATIETFIKNGSYEEMEQFLFKLNNDPLRIEVVMTILLDVEIFDKCMLEAFHCSLFIQDCLWTLDNIKLLIGKLCVHYVEMKDWSVKSIQLENLFKIVENAFRDRSIQNEESQIALPIFNFLEKYLLFNIEHWKHANYIRSWQYFKIMVIFEVIQFDKSCDIILQMFNFLKNIEFSILQAEQLKNYFTFCKAIKIMFEIFYENFEKQVREEIIDFFKCVLKTSTNYKVINETLFILRDLPVEYLKHYVTPPFDDFYIEPNSLELNHFQMEMLANFKQILLIDIALEKIKIYDNLSNFICDELFDYVFERLNPDQNVATIETISKILAKYFEKKLLNILLKQIKDLQSDLDSQPTNWIKHHNHFFIFENMLAPIFNECEVEFGTSYESFKREQHKDKWKIYFVKWFHYFETLIQQCSDMETIEIACQTICKFLRKPSNNQIDYNKQSFIVMIRQAMISLFKTIKETETSSCSVNWNGVRNLFLLFLKFLNLYSVNFLWIYILPVFLLEDRKNGFDFCKYVLDLIEKCACDQTILILLLLLEKCNMHGKDEISQNQMEQLKHKLAQLVNRYNESNANYVQENIYLFANWALRCSIPNRIAIKLFCDKFTARNDLYPFSCTKFAFPITSGVYYYEVTLQTDGMLLIGWSTNKYVFEFMQEQDDRKFITNIKFWNQTNEEVQIFDENRNKIKLWSKHKKNSENALICLPYLDAYDIKSNNNWEKKEIYSNWKAGAVVGCLADLDLDRFVFYLNGIKIAEQVIEFDSPRTYYATAWLGRHQQCQFNFGQFPFKYAPDLSNNFKQKFIKSEQSYQLLDCICVKENFVGYKDNHGPKIHFTLFNFWFRHLPANGEIIPYYSDEKQKIFDNLVIEMCRNMFQHDTRFEMFDIEIKSERFVQAFLSQSSTFNNDTKLDILAYWLNEIFQEKQIVEKIKAKKLYEILYPYLMLNNQNPKHLFITLLLAKLLQYENIHQYKLTEHLQNKIFEYLLEIIPEKNQHQKEAQLYALIALENVNLTEEQKEKTKSKLASLVECMEYFNKLIAKNEWIIEWRHYFGRMQYQLMFASFNLHKHILKNIQQTIDSRHLASNAILSSEDSQVAIKLTPDRLSARNDWDWLSVRSVCSATKNNVIYYEVMLLTGGPMRIGWASKWSTASETEVGGDQFSIGFDGYNQCLWQGDEQIPIENPVMWHCGDVIGCLIDLTKYEFHFFVNGKQIMYDIKDVYISRKLDYFAAVRLGAHQHCGFNFGQQQFLYPPKQFKFKDFCGNDSEANQNITINNSNITGSLVGTNINLNDFNATCIIDQQLTPTSFNSANDLRRTKKESPFPRNVPCKKCNQIVYQYSTFEKCEHIHYCKQCFNECNFPYCPVCKDIYG